MSIGKYISLEEARNSKDLDRFIREHPSKAPRKDFEELLERMCLARKPEEGDRT